ncbi:expansin EXLX1 family cellulose-binding protein [Promicromonospora soli]
MYWLIWGAVVALALVGVLSYLVMASLPDGAADAGRTVAAAGVRAPQVSTPTATAKGKPTPKATPSPKASASAPAPSPSPSPTAAPPATSTTAASAGRIRPGTTYKGDATHYEAADGNGACLFGPSDDMMIAAMNETDYEASKACGAYVLVRAANGKSVTVRITNLCPLPCAPGQLDLSREAFSELADWKLGRIPITWTLLSPGTSDTISIRYKDGSSQWWCGIQVIDHRNPVAKLEVGVGGGWRALPRTGYNYFLAEDGNGCGGAIRITDIYGERLTVEALPVRADVVQATGVQFAQH